MVATNGVFQPKLAGVTTNQPLIVRNDSRNQISVTVFANRPSSAMPGQQEIVRVRGMRAEIFPGNQGVTRLAQAGLYRLKDDIIGRSGVGPGNQPSGEDLRLRSQYEFEMQQLLAR